MVCVIGLGATLFARFLCLFLYQPKYHIGGDQIAVHLLLPHGAALTLHLRPTLRGTVCGVHQCFRNGFSLPEQFLPVRLGQMALQMQLSIVQDIAPGPLVIKHHGIGPHAMHPAPHNGRSLHNAAKFSESYICQNLPRPNGSSHFTKKASIDLSVYSSILLSISVPLQFRDRTAYSSPTVPIFSLVCSRSCLYTTACCAQVRPQMTTAQTITRKHTARK